MSPKSLNALRTLLAAVLCAAVVALVACPGSNDDDASPNDDDAGDDDTANDDDTADDDDATDPFDVNVLILLDGSPAPDVTIGQAGLPDRWTTGPDGTATIPFDPTLEADHFVIASHPEARQNAGPVPDDEPVPDPLTIELTSFDASDNPDYVFREGGAPDQWESTEFCAHCHRTITNAWHGSPHRTAASNPAVQDLYAGVRSNITSEGACAAAGGQWWTGLEPGTGAAAQRCYLGDGALPALNNNCGDDTPCDEAATAFGGCADCHAPGIDGQLGGRDLLEATGYAHDDGVHCDVCHKVESIDPTGEPGVAGYLHIVRPSESGGFGQEFLPLMFGPYDDVPTGVMGAVARPHFRDATLCGGCHEQHQPALAPGDTIDTARWPSGRLPIHTTFSEWQGSSLSPSTPCQICHMPPDTDVTNSADLQLFELEPGFVPGWVRAPGEVREHSWIGPRQPASGLLQTAGGVSISKEVVDSQLTATVTTFNAGTGHGLPTGEPMRSVLLRVEATCADAPLTATGGDVVPDFGGALASQDSSGDWTTWPGAQPGERIRVVARPGDWVDYPGYGPFGDGTFTAAQKGMPIEQFVGEVEIVAVDGAVVTTNEPVPAGDIAYRVEASGPPEHGDAALGAAGAPGFGFARVLTDSQGRRMVPHFLATDVVSDNRILPLEQWVTTHTFDSPCADPVVHAVLVHRSYPLALARERGWSLTESVIADTSL